MAALNNLLQTAALAGSRSAERREAKKSRKHKTGAWRLHWEDALREYYPEAGVSYTTTDAANLKRAVARGIEQDDMGEFLAWSVKNWERIRLASSFNAKPRGPSIPDMKFLIVVINQAHAAYVADRDSATLDLSKRRESLRGPSVQPTEPEPVSPALRLLPPPPAPARQAPRPLQPVSRERVQSEITRLGLKQWESRK